MLEDSLELMSTAMMNKPTRDQTTTGVVPEKKNDISVVIADSKLNTVLSATSLTLFLVLAVVVFVLVVPIAFLCTHKRRAEESKSARVNSTKMREFATKSISPTYDFNTYSESPIHNLYSSEEKAESF